MLSFFDFLGEAVYSLFSMIGNLYQSLTMAILIIYNAVPYVGKFIYLLPGIISASAAVVISVAVVKFIVGR